MSTPSADAVALPRTQDAWRAALASLPDAPAKLPVFYFAHGSPMLVMTEKLLAGIGSRARAAVTMGPNSPHAAFLRDFGPTLLTKFKPRAIVVFSAHWDTREELLVTDYGVENPLLYDYYGFAPEMYALQFKSAGDAAVSARVVQLFTDAGLFARTTPVNEPRGRDGRGFAGPGFDHGVFVPFRLMFGDALEGVPVVEVSFDSSYDPERNWAVGQALAKLREEGILVLSGGLNMHNQRDFDSFVESTASPLHRAFDKAMLDAITISDEEARKQALLDLVKHEGFRAAHPTADHFIPLYVAAGAGEGGDVKVLQANYGRHTYAFGL